MEPARLNGERSTALISDYRSTPCINSTWTMMGGQRGGDCGPSNEGCRH